MRHSSSHNMGKQWPIKVHGRYNFIFRTLSMINDSFANIHPPESILIFNCPQINPTAQLQTNASMPSQVSNKLPGSVSVGIQVIACLEEGPSWMYGFILNVLCTYISKVEVTIMILNEPTVSMKTAFLAHCNTTRESEPKTIWLHTHVPIDSSVRRSETRERSEHSSTQFWRRNECIIWEEILLWTVWVTSCLSAYSTDRLG